MQLISVILPVYNGLEFLGDAVKSVLAQKFNDFELILVDDGSTDGSSALCDQLALTDPRIKVLHTSNGGLSAARNRGLEIATGAWISFIDADDMLHPAALGYLFELVSISDDIDMAVGSFSTSEKFLSRPLQRGKVRVMQPVELVAETLYQRGAVHAAWGKLYRRSLFENRLFTEGLYYEDLDFFYRYCLACRLTAVSDAQLYFYRQQPGSIMHTWKPRRLDVLKITEEIERYMASEYPELRRAAADRRLSANFNIFILASANGQPEVANRCWEIVKQYRRDSLKDKNVRFKNKAGIMLSYLGKNIFKIISRWAGA